MSCFGLTLRRILRCVPDFGTESVTPWEIACRLDLGRDQVEQALSRAARRGLVVRLRIGDYQLAPRAGHMGGAAR